MRLLFLALLILAAPAWAGPTRYINDDLQVVIRSGPSLQHRIIKMVPTGTPVEQLGVSGDWTHLRTKEGLAGWIESRHIATTPGARERLEAADATIGRLREELSQAKQSAGAQAKQLASTQQQAAQLTTVSEQMKQQLAEAGRGLALSEENKDLRKQMADLQRSLEMAQNDVSRLQDRRDLDWFVKGALVVFAGFIAGIIVTRIRWKKKSTWGSL